MAAPNTLPARRWIVLVRKSPLGPFSQAEVKSLLTKGSVRINDLAVLVDENAPSPPTRDWKFLYQFAEFDRRKRQEPHDPERRTAQTLTSPSLTQVPSALSSLSTKELSERSRQAWNAERRDSTEIILFPERRKHLLWSALPLIGFLLLPAVVSWEKIRRKTPEPVIAEAPAPEVSRSPASSRWNYESKVPVGLSPARRRTPAE